MGSLICVFALICAVLAADQLSDRDKRRIDCYPEPNASPDACKARGCIWGEIQSDDKYLPFCFFPDGIGYNVASQSGNKYTLTKTGGKNPWDSDFATIDLNVQSLGSVLNVKFGQSGRYEPSLEIPRETISASDSLYFMVDNSTSPSSFHVHRQSTGRKIFDTSIGGLIFSDRFIQIASYLPSDKMYGWGENIHQQINHDFSRYLKWAMFARDEPPNSLGLDTKNLYGVHPYYMVIEPDGKAHGVFILNSNAMDVSTLPAPGFVYRTIGGNLDIYFFPGPTPDEVTRQYLSFVGKPMLPAYWSLGFQLCRYGYKDLNEMIQIISNVRGYGIPIDVAMADIDYMDRYKDFTVGSNWANLPQYAKQLHDWGMKLILIWDPAIQVDYEVFKRGLDSGAKFIEWEKESQVQRSNQDLYPLAKNTKVMLGVVWPDRHVAFPDFLDPSNKTTKWWADEFVKFHQQVPYDGIWIDMNEPSNFGTNDPHPWYYDSPDHPDDPPLFCPTTGDDAYWENAPYQTHAVYNDGGSLFTKTLCMLALTSGGSGRFYNTKNLYGWSEAKSTQQALYQATGQRGTIITRSTFPSGGRYAGHWLGDNTARWEDLRTSVIGAQEFNLFGYPYVGSDICGFIGTTNEELCLRWQQLGSYHSFSRNHNNNNSPPQDPAQWPTVAAATKKANLFRYRHLPYIFSLHFAASLIGGTVVRPVFYEFPTDAQTHTLSYQFMWGPAIMVAPVTEQGATSVRAYLPDGNWYSLYDNLPNQKVNVGWSDFPAPTTFNTPTFIRGGFIVPRQSPNVTTTASRLNPFELVAALDAKNFAGGELYWDDGVSIVQDFSTYNYHHFNFTVLIGTSSNSMVIECTKRATNLKLPTLDVIEVLGYPSYVDFTSFTLNGKPLDVDTQRSSYSPLKKVLTIAGANLIDLNSSDELNIMWKKASVIVPEEVGKSQHKSFYQHNELI